MIIISNDLFVVLRDERYFFLGGNIFFFYIFGMRNIFFCRKRYFNLKKYVFFVDFEYEKIEDEVRDVFYKIRNIIRIIN